jgi:hypothetical protein
MPLPALIRQDFYLQQRLPLFFRYSFQRLVDHPRQLVRALTAAASRNCFSTPAINEGTVSAFSPAMDVVITLRRR